MAESIVVRSQEPSTLAPALPTSSCWGVPAQDVLYGRVGEPLLPLNERLQCLGPEPTSLIISIPLPIAVPLVS